MSEEKHKICQITAYMTVLNDDEDRIKITLEVLEEALLAQSFKATGSYEQLYDEISKGVRQYYSLPHVSDIDTPMVAMSKRITELERLTEKLIKREADQ